MSETLGEPPKFRMSSVRLVHIRVWTPPRGVFFLAVFCLRPGVSRTFEVGIYHIYTIFCIIYIYISKFKKKHIPIQIQDGPKYLTHFSPHPLIR